MTLLPEPRDRAVAALRISPTALGPAPSPPSTCCARPPRTSGPPTGSPAPTAISRSVWKPGCATAATRIPTNSPPPRTG
ncbi:zinc finger protein 839 [Streptomyces sp. AD16]|nr:zinc finger protein 839 [Streptomyces sp. AD16]